MSIIELQSAQQSLEVQRLQARFKEIHTKLVDQTPGIVDAMVDIHKILQQHEELVHLLSDDDIAALHKAHETHKQVVLIQTTAKTTTGKGRNKLTDGQLKNL